MKYITKNGMQIRIPHLMIFKKKFTISYSFKEISDTNCKLQDEEMKVVDHRVIITIITVIIY